MSACVDDRHFETIDEFDLGEPIFAVLIVLLQESGPRSSWELQAGLRHSGRQLSGSGEVLRKWPV